ncbi:uncharacterized protein LOC113235945 [Hyposmocoma kahamanoa]|uniref:uncharacterized protein LOC113235945 n=1 Tax=Hyposmocoma kahamanoa TaxID=1477025 RepID=UPI000E6D8998|nr:uncharacterized protein LOC113235945 [Hyposmocoma kahamanoa]
MEMLNREEICIIVDSSTNNSNYKILNWSLVNYADHLIGYLGDHLKLTVEIEENNAKQELQYFVKCTPLYDSWKIEYMKKVPFFEKEFRMLSSLFTQFNQAGGYKRWCPRPLYIKENLFVFEDLAVLGYKMPNQEFLTYNETIAVAEAIAKFHAQSYIYEEKKSKQLGRPYRIWEDYSEYLQEPTLGSDWRDTGRNAVIDYLKVFSKYKDLPNFERHVETIITKLYEDVWTLMKPSIKYRNVVLHRDIWKNNILLKTLANGTVHAMIVDYQTVLYCSGMLDLSSFIYFNTNKNFRHNYLRNVQDHYYDILSRELNNVGIDISTVYSDKSVMLDSYEESLLFGLTQSGIIVPISAMGQNKTEELFCNPETSATINTVSRSQEFIQIARENSNYENRVTDILDEMLERYVPNLNLFK